MNNQIKTSVLLGVSTSIAFLLGTITMASFSFYSVSQAEEVALATIQSCDYFEASHDISLAKLRVHLLELVKSREELTSEGWERLELISMEMVKNERVVLMEKIMKDESAEYINNAKQLVEKIDLLVSTKI